MAYRDKTQGFAFVYVDIKKLLEENKGRKGVITPKSNNVLNFNRDPKKLDTEIESKDSSREIESRMGNWDAKKVSDTTKLTRTEKQKAVKQIKENLDRLQSLHHRLHTVLSDLNKASKKNKKKK